MMRIRNSCEELSSSTPVGVPSHCAQYPMYIVTRTARRPTGQYSNGFARGKTAIVANHKRETIKSQ
jgi:hypothetical protein